MPDFSVLLSGEGLVSLISLTALEIVLGIDNIIFIAILSQKVAAERRSQVRRTGLALALVLRIGLLLGLSWLMGLTRPLFTLLGSPLSGRDLVLLVGGLFLIGKAAHEIYEKTEGEAPAEDAQGAPAPSVSAGFAVTLAQILALDIVFSLDSVITAVGMARAVLIMVTAMIIAVGVMLVFADAVSEFINRHPSMRVLALSFLLLIGVLLVADAFDKHINKGYVYFAMAFSFLVELLNMRGRRKRRGLRRENDAQRVAPRSVP
ncbi:MAG TPA: TerC family protein [Polyangia bacterium]|nr:TerC family protein [Polyangia bacterium]